MNSEKFLNKHFWSIIGVALAIGVWRLFFGQRMPHLGTLGDEKFYLAMTAALKYFLFESGLNEYRLQRILPCALVHYTMKLFNIPFEVKSIGTVFAVYDCLMYGIVAFVWCLISKELKLSVKGKWLGVLAIYGTYHLLKYIPFMPVSTDMFAYTITLSLIYFYLRNNWIGLSILTMLGGFVWPTVIYMGIALILFPKEKDFGQMYAPAPKYLNYAIPVLALIPLMWYWWSILQKIFTGVMYQYGIFSMGSNKPLVSVIYLSTFIVAAYLFLALGLLLNNSKFFKWSFWKNQFHWKRILIAGIVLLAVKLTVYNLASVQNARPILYLIANLLMVSTMQPASFLVTHVLYFGPMVILLIILWKPICRIIQEHGLGLVICAVLVVLFSLDSESRKQMSTYPILLPFLIKALDSFQLKKFHYGILIVLSLIASKVWFKINPEGWGSALEFPAQSYYMTMGAWMSHKMYFIQGAAVLATIILIYFTFFFKRGNMLVNHES